MDNCSSSIPRVGRRSRSVQKWEGSTLVMHWELTVRGINLCLGYSDVPSADGKVLTMAEQYREPGMERIRDWAYEKQ